MLQSQAKEAERRAGAAAVPGEAAVGLVPMTRVPLPGLVEREETATARRPPEKPPRKRPPRQQQPKANADAAQFVSNLDDGGILTGCELKSASCSYNELSQQLPNLGGLEVAVEDFKNCFKKSNLPGDQPVTPRQHRPSDTTTTDDNLGKSSLINISISF
jgi:hypothetical protein